MDNPDVEDEEKRYFRIGSALDTLLTDNEEFHNEFKIVSSVRPWGLMGKFVDALPLGLEQDAPQEQYQEAYEKSGYKMRIDRVWSKFWENSDAVEYYQDLCCEDDGRSVLSKDEFDLVINMKELIMSNPFTHRYFFSYDDDIEIHSQIPIYFEYAGLACKALMDGIIVNHKDKTIQPYDLKTSGKSVHEFEKWIPMYGYHRQAAFYSIALENWIEDYFGQIKAVTGAVLNYEVLPFKFVVVESKVSSQVPAIIYELSQEDLEAGLNGGYRDGRYIPGVNQLIEDYKWHLKEDKWQLPRKLYESDGIKKTSIFDSK